jgi:acetolactate synthase-1/2/3 large subunit
VSKQNGSRIICNTMEQLGLEYVFGLPGTQTIELYEALRRSSLRTILATNELAAAFMANGFARASGRASVLATIPGPGFAYTIAGLAEALRDSVPLLHIVPKPTPTASSSSGLPGIDQKAIALPVVKSVYEVECVSDIEGTLCIAYGTALEGEPGPVLIQIASHIFSAPSPESHAVRTEDAIAGLRRAPPVIPEQIDVVLKKIVASQRIVLYCGQGANGAADAICALAELLRAPVITTCSARGLLPENHPLSIVFNSDRGSVRTLNRLIERSDLVLSLGCKLSFNIAGVPPEKLVYVDSLQNTLEDHHATTIRIRSTIDDFLAEILRNRGALQLRSIGWEAGEVQRWREDVPREAMQALVEPKFTDITPSTAAAFFDALRKAMPANGCLVTDSGRHQVLARVHFRALSPRALIVPSGFQSMGFGLPAAMGAKLASPERPVVALIGDGGFAMSGMELLTAVRNHIPLTVVVFNDGALGQIRLEQVTAFGIEHSTSLINPDLEMFAAALGINYFRLAGDAAGILRQAIHEGGVSLVEVRLGESSSFHIRRVEALARRTGQHILGPKLAGKLKRWLKSHSKGGK